MKSNPVSLSLPHKRKGQGHRSFKKKFKQKRNPDAPKTRKELRKEQRKMKKAEKHTFLLRKFGKEVEVPKKKRRQQKKKNKSKDKAPMKSNRRDTQELTEGSGSESDYDASVPLKTEVDKLKLEMEEVRKKRMVEDNDEEDRTIRSLQKKLKLNKKAQVPASFRVDGLDYLLDFCNDLDKKKDSVDPQSEKEAKRFSKVSEGEDDDEDEESDDASVDLGSEDSEVDEDDIDLSSEDELDEDEDQQEVDGEDEEKDEPEEDLSENDEPLEDQLDEEDAEEDSEDDAADDHSDDLDSSDESPKKKPKKEKDTEFWEDIYGRMRDKEGNVVKDIQIASAVSTTPSASTGKYVPPMRRQSQKSDKIKQSLKGLFNRLSESNMHSIATHIESFYMDNSRNEMNETLLELMSAVLVSPILSSDRIILEHVMLIGILHANVGTEVGAFFIQSLTHQFHKLYQQNTANQEQTEGKELENLVLIISYMYHFKIVDCCLIYDILKLLGDSFGPKDVELILTILRSIGFRLRKDDPAALKSLIQLLQQKASQAQIDRQGSRVKFMLEILLAIRNNNMTKIPNYDPSFGDHLQKIMKTFIHKGNYISELKISLQDLLNADTRGRWWILGSAWTNTGSTSAVPGSGDDKPAMDQSGQSVTVALGNKKLMKKAKKLGMNTDTRRNIFFILMTAEDYADAFEKLNHLGLKNQLEREIIHVLIYCCLHEKKFNPYYALLASKFCSLDRRFMLTTQYTLWDRLKEFPVPEEHQLKNLTELLIHLVKDRSVPLTVLKVIDFGDMPPWKLVFLKEVLGGILLRSTKDELEDVFTKPGLSEKLRLFRDSVKLFMNHFMLNEQEVVTPDGETTPLVFTDPAIKNKLKERIELAEKALSLGHSKVQF